jgi:hypothetical protein
LERLSFDEDEAKVSYRDGKKGEELQVTDYPGSIARVTSHIPDKGRVMPLFDEAMENAVQSKSLSCSHPDSIALFASYLLPIFLLHTEELGDNDVICCSVAVEIISPWRGNNSDGDTTWHRSRHFKPRRDKR